MKVCTTTIFYLFFARCFFVPKVCTYVHRAKSVFSLDYIIKKVIEKLRKPPSSLYQLKQVFFSTKFGSF